jgi:capsular polysaccharide export protein
MILQGLSAFQHKRVLLLQGPVGPFFHRLSKDLRNAGAQVFKVNFNGGDWLFYRQEAIGFQGSIDEWPVFLEKLIERLNIDTVMLFGDCRIYHTAAYKIAKRLGLEVGVFEEGYFRPDYVTMEREGVNGYSPLPANPIYYLNNVDATKVRTDPVGNTFWHAALWACMYYLAAQLLHFCFPRYRHHRPLSVKEAWPWVRSAWRKTAYAIIERNKQATLTGALSKKFFLLPLQVHNDAQIHVHSEFASVEFFIRHVVASFAAHAHKDNILVIKHHPMDRGYTDYSALIRQLRKEFVLGARLLYIHDQHLPSLLDHARGVVLVNSTVGLSALFHNAPLKVCGSAIYNMQGLTYQGALDDFWGEAQFHSINPDLFERFRGYVIEKTQLNGSFYKRLPIPGCYTGMRWEERWLLGSSDQGKPEQRTITAGAAVSARNTSAAAPSVSASSAQ